MNIHDNVSLGEQLFQDIKMSKPQGTLFPNQYLLILKRSSQKKVSKKIDFQCLTSADHAYVIKRNPKGQIYFITDLHLHVHCTISESQIGRLVDVITEKKEIRVILPTENLVRGDFAVWNTDHDYGTGDSPTFLADTSNLIERIFPGFQTGMNIPHELDSRGTIAANIGLTVNDCNQYVKNRSTIFGTIRPYLIKMVSWS
jgi:hypothetical protein